MALRKPGDRSKGKGRVDVLQCEHSLCFGDADDAARAPTEACGLQPDLGAGNPRALGVAHRAVYRNPTLQFERDLLFTWDDRDRLAVAAIGHQARRAQRHTVEHDETAVVGSPAHQGCVGQTPLRAAHVDLIRRWNVGVPPSARSNAGGSRLLQRDSGFPSRSRLPDDLSTYDRVSGSPSEIPSMEGRVRALRQEHRAIHRPGFVQIDDRDVTD